MSASFKVTKNEWGRVKTGLRKLPTAASDWGEQWAKDSVNNLDRIYRNHLETQGRGGEPPPLSEATRELYRQMGDPDGSGIRNHITLEYEETPHGFKAVFGIPEGRPSMIARVQDQGAIIPVSQRMRGFLAVHGIFLKATTTHIEIPARYSWSKSNRRAKAEARRRLDSFWHDVWVVACAAP